MILHTPMDGSDIGSVSDPSISSTGDPHKRAWGLRSCKGPKMRDLESVLRFAGTGTSNLESSIKHHGKEDEGSKIEETTSTVLSDRLKHETTCHSSLTLERDAACFTRGSSGNIQSSIAMDIDGAAECKQNMTMLCFSMSPDKERGTPNMASTGLAMDLNTRDVANTAEQNPFYPYKRLGQGKPPHASECGSTTGPLEENESLRMWKKMKQNGFMSSHGGIPMPKQQARKSKKRKDDKTKKKIDIPKREQPNRFTKLAAPSGLLSGLDLGIIKHVRNSKQVHSILEAMLRSEDHDVQIQNRVTSQLGRGGSKEANYRRKDHTYALYPALNQSTLSLDTPSGLSSYRGANISETDIAEKRFQHDASTSSKLNSKYNSDILELKLSSGVTMGSDNSSSVSDDGFSVNQETTASLSLKAASVASQWLELLQLDIEGRLAALQRSKKRVINVIQTELPYLLSRKLSSDLENESPSGHPSGAESSISHMHVKRWISLFSRMNGDLYEEAKQLESWLEQVQDMQLHCAKGLRYIGADGLAQLGLPEASRSSKDLDEMECEVMAAAASIYSTCSLILSKENVPCF